MLIKRYHIKSMLSVNLVKVLSLHLGLTSIFSDEKEGHSNTTSR